MVLPRFYKTECSTSSEVQCRPVFPGCAGCAMAHLDFGRSVNPISTRGDRLCPPNYYLLAHPDFQTFRRPWNMSCQATFHQEKSSQFKIPMSIKICAKWGCISAPRIRYCSFKTLYIHLMSINVSLVVEFLR